MPTTTLTLGAVEFRGTPDPIEEIVGDPPQWSDGSDATYIYTASVVTVGFPSGGGGYAPVTVPVAGTLTALRFFIRAKAEPGFGANPAKLDPYLTDSSSLVATDPGSGFADIADRWSLPHDGAIHEEWIDGVVYPDANPEGWLTSPDLKVVVNVGTTFSRVWIYEVRCEVTTTVDEVLVTRLFPRKDAHGPMGSAPRLIGNIPPERIVGGHM